MKSENGKAIITLFSQLNEQRIEIFLTDEGWMEYEILLESEELPEEKVG